MTGTSSARPVAVSAVAIAVDEVHADAMDETFVVEAEDAPFVEIGGPTGTVFSPSPVAAPAKPVAKVKTEEPTGRAFPRITPDSAPAYLSVRFHDAVPPVPGHAAGVPDHGLVALHFPDHQVSSEYRTLRDEIAKQLPDATSRSLTFTAASPAAGTTTVLANLGVTLARAGQRVLLVDANVTRPGVAQKLALRPAPGLAEVLSGNLPLTWALQPTPVPSMQALVAGDATDTIAGAIGRDLPKLVGQLRQWFNWVLIDNGVWGVLPERDATCASSDAVYLVTREPDADRPEFVGLRTCVKQLGGALRGYVTTRV